MIGNSHLDVVDAHHMGDICEDTRVCECPVLRDSLLLQIRWAEVRKWIVARIVIVAIPSDEAAEVKHGGRSDVKGVDLRSLVCRTDRDAIGTKPVIADANPVPRRRVLRVIRIGRLEPGTAKAEIQMDRVLGRELIVHPVENTFFVAFVVHHDKFRGVQESPRIQSVRRDEIPPLITTISKVKADIRRAKRSVGSIHTAMRSF